MIMLTTFYDLDAPFLQGSLFPFGYVTSYDAGTCRWEEMVVRGAVNCGWRFESGPTNVATWLVLLHLQSFCLFFLACFLLLFVIYRPSSASFIFSFPSVFSCLLIFPMLHLFGFSSFFLLSYLSFCSLFWNNLNKSKFHLWRKWEQIEVRQYLLLFGAEYFVFRFAVQKYKD